MANKNITLEDFIDNPMGNGNAVLSAAARNGIKVTYKAKFDNILLRENGKINYYLYVDPNNNTYYVHVKVPSEICKKFYYDVVFKFFADASIKDAGRHLDKYYVQFYSNDPAFVYTYAHAFIKNNIFIKDLIPKMSKDAVKYKAKEKNPDDLNGYSKIIYFGYLFIKERGLLSRLSWGGAEKFDIKYLIDNITDADTKIAERQEEGKKYSKKKIVISSDIAKKISKYDLTDAAKERLVTTTNKTVGVKKVAAINNKFSGNIRKTKKIK